MFANSARTLSEMRVNGYLEATLASEYMIGVRKRRSGIASPLRTYSRGSTFSDHRQRLQLASEAGGSRACNLAICAIVICRY